MYVDRPAVDEPGRARHSIPRPQSDKLLGARPDSVQRDGAVKDLPGLGANQPATEILDPQDMKRVMVG
jgi:hypothetical protein